VRALILVFSLLTACVDSGQIYDCTGAFKCGGDHFGLGELHICTTSAEEAGELFSAYAQELSKEAKCGTSFDVWWTCESTEVYCKLEEKDAE
jgi:hypothetical protein